MPANKILYESKNGAFEVARRSKGVGKGIFYQFSIVNTVNVDGEQYAVNFANVSISQMQSIADAINNDLQFAGSNKPTKPINLFVENKG